MIDRHEYLDQLEVWRDRDVIKVITGVRRSGKSTLLDMYGQRLVASGVSIDRVIRVNLEDYAASTTLDAFWLFDFINNQLKPGAPNYVLIDEVQLATDWQKAVNAIYRRPETDVYVTGSNACVLSGELATFLTGRYVTIPMYPLSFKEYRRALPEVTDRLQLYGRYIRHGGFPYVASLADDHQVKTYLDDVYSSILLKDVMKRYNFRDAGALSRVALFLLDNIGNVLSLRNIQTALRQEGYDLSVHTLDNYLRALVECFLVYRVERFDVQGKALLQTGTKYYAADVGWRYHLSGQRLRDTGRCLENLVYLELRRRGYSVYVGKSGDFEVDFVAIDHGNIHYVQVAERLGSPQTLDRELRSLLAIQDNYPKTIVTLEMVPDKANDQGIVTRYALDWFLDETTQCVV